MRYHRKRGRQESSQAGHKLNALSELSIGTMAIVEALDLPDEVGHHLMHMGIVPEARIVVIRRAPAGDPTVYYIDGFEIALRRETARSIRVRPVEEDH
ncbi:MAG TPA: FeoA family protein [Silvibacterium sp.]|nr:FeoA family protein [Silvibacterium sp.]